MYSHDVIGNPDCPLAERWIISIAGYSIRLHHFMTSDDRRAYHDHPWWFITFVIKGGYTDESPKGKDHLGRFSIRFRRALHKHTVVIDEGGVWTIILTGRKKRKWGFWLNSKFIKSNKYHLKYGHPICED